MATRESIPANTLTAADLQSHPVWRFCMDGEGAGDAADVDESHIAPSTEPLALGSFGSYLVAATYGLQNWSSLPGSVQVDVLDHQVHFTPAVVYARGKSVDPLARDAAQRLSRITQTPDARPLRWELAVTFHGERAARRGRIARSALGTALALLARLVLLRFSRRQP